MYSRIEVGWGLANSSSGTTVTINVPTTLLEVLTGNGRVVSAKRRVLGLSDDRTKVRASSS